MILSTTLLKKGVEAGLNLYEIASLVCRKKKTETSELEKLLEHAEGKGWGGGKEEIETFVGDFIAEKKKKTAK